MENRLKELTTPQHRCSHSISCPAVFYSSDKDTYVIIGNTVDHQSMELSGRVASHETVIEIPAEILEAAIKNTILRKHVK